MQEVLHFQTHGRGFINITRSIQEFVFQSDVKVGLCNLFLHHTSASLIIGENADPLVLKDLEVFFQRFIPDDETLYQHIAEGPDDMPSHIRTVLTQTSISIPITSNKLVLGTWQGIFLWEHRMQSHSRHLTVTLLKSS